MDVAEARSVASLLTAFPGSKRLPVLRQASLERDGRALHPCRCGQLTTLIDAAGKGWHSTCAGYR